MTIRSSIERLADCAPIETPAYEAASRTVATRARRLAIGIVKTRARDYIRAPWQMDFLGWHAGFFAQGSLMTPSQLIAFAREVLRLERANPSFEFIPVKQINAKAAIIAGRYRRAKERD
jgi:hypothetical protein